MPVTTRTFQPPQSGDESWVQFQDWKNREKCQSPTIDEAELHQRTLAMGNWTDFNFREGRPAGSGVDFYGNQQWKRLYDHHHDNWWKYRNEVHVHASVDRRWKEHTIYAFGGELEMSDHQRQEAFSQLMSLDIPRTGLSVVENAFCICALVVNQDAKRCGGETVYHPQQKDENKATDFLRLERSLKAVYPRITQFSLTSLYNKLGQGNPPRRDEMDWKPYFRNEPLTPQDPDAQAQFTPEMTG